MDGLLFGEKLGPMPLTTVVNTLQTRIQPEKNQITGLNKINKDHLTHAELT